jgi:hypothetical protein
LHYKVLALIYEQSRKQGMYSVVDNSQEPIKWRDKELYISCTVDTFLKRFPSDFIEIQHRALLSLYRTYPNYGQHLKNFEYYHFFARDELEMGYIMSSLIAKNIISGKVNENGDGTFRFQYPYKITPEGWNEIEKSVYTEYSKQVFIAMSFADEMKNIRASIKAAIEEAGLEAILIDEVEHINYIPIEIQNKIKNCRFLIVDLTTQNKGAYFETGYAMGLNIPVIWCCKDEDKQNLHFDIRQYNNILWIDEKDLYVRLKKRLLALRGNP